MIEFEVLYFAGCPHWETAARRVRQVAAEVGAAVRERCITAPDAVGFAGSPTILVDGRDPFAGTERSGAMSCRLYPTPEGPAGSPTLEQLRRAIPGVIPP